MHDEKAMARPIGVIEGFYGSPYSWQDRRDLVEFLAAEGYDHYIYAPKADRCLREEWDQEHSPVDFLELRAFGAHCRQHGIAWGVGISPPNGEDGGRNQDLTRLLQRVEQLAALSIERLALLFDDMRGHDQLATYQAAIVDAVRLRFPELRLMLCPTYYSMSRVLDRLFGERPRDYLQQLGALLPACVDIFWTGPDICSATYPPEHLAEVAGWLQRQPWLWDNYPVNDGARMYRFLHLRGFPPRTSELCALTCGISVNPLTQAWLSRLPLAGLPRSLLRKAPVDRDQAFLEIGGRLLPAPLFDLLRRDFRRFHDEGLDVLNPEARHRAIAEYGSIDHPAAREVVHWLRGETRPDSHHGT
jgi:hyaluronoglucosaminidase